MSSRTTATPATAWGGEPAPDVDALRGGELNITDTSSTLVPQDSESLPSLLARAGQRLLDARSAGEVLEAKKIAEAALALAKITKAANETHADCLRIILRAEMRMAEEIDADPNVAPRGWKSDVQRSDITTLDDIGVSRQRLAEWRGVRDAGEEVVEEAIQEALDEGRAPTKADITRKVRGTQGTGDNEWFTPAEWIELARAVLGAIDTDPASNEHAQRTVRASVFYTKETDGLTKDWNGNIWLNPPYAQPFISHFADKMIEELDNGNVSSAIMLTHNYTDTQWFQKLTARADSICFPRGRIRFEAPDGSLASPTQGQAFFYFGNQPEVFVSTFGKIGRVLRPLLSLEMPPR